VTLHSVLGVVSVVYISFFKLNQKEREGKGRDDNSYSRVTFGSC
jgi:hypothetical protein